MSTPNVTLDESEVQRRSQAWHALAALQGPQSASSGLLFTTERRKAAARVRRTTPADMHVSGHVPVDCLRLVDVMD